MLLLCYYLYYIINKYQPLIFVCPRRIDFCQVLVRADKICYDINNMMTKYSQLPPPDKKPLPPALGPNGVNTPVPWHIWHPFLVLLMALLLAAVPAAFGEMGLSLLSMSYLSLFLQDAAFFLGPLIIACAYYKCSPALLGMSRISLWQVLRIGIPAGIALYVLNLATSFIINVLFPGKIAQSQDVLNLFHLADDSLAQIILIIFICLIAPLTEEMLFRAFLYPPLKRICGRTWGIILTGAIFALVHMNIWTFVPLCVGGIGFAWLYDRYGNLWVNFCAHVVWNVIVLVLYFIV